MRRLSQAPDAVGSVTDGRHLAVVQLLVGHANIQTTWICNRPTMRDSRRLLDSGWERINAEGKAGAAADGKRGGAPNGVVQALSASLERGEITLAQFRATFYALVTASNA